MGKWNNAQFLLSEEIVGFVHNLLADYQCCDFATFRSRLLELVNGQSEIKGILNEEPSYFQELQEGVGELKTVYEQLAVAYQEDKYPSIVLSEEELSRLADEVVYRFDDAVRNNSLEGVLAKIEELTEKKAAPPARTEVPNYSQKFNQLLTAMNNIQQQNREMAEKIDEMQSKGVQTEKDEASRMQEDNQSLLQALNKYKAAYVTLKNERNDLAMQLDKLKKENFLRIRRKELQDALLEQKENEITRLKEELAALKSEKGMATAVLTPDKKGRAGETANRAKPTNEPGKAAALTGKEDGSAQSGKQHGETGLERVKKR